MLTVSVAAEAPAAIAPAPRIGTANAQVLRTHRRLSLLAPNIDRIVHRRSGPAA